MGKQYYLPIECGAVALFWNTDSAQYAAGLSGRAEDLGRVRRGISPAS